MSDMIKKAATTLLDWHDSIEDPERMALAMTQGQEAADKVAQMGLGIEAQASAYTRRYLESLAFDNYGLIAMLTPADRDPE